MITRLRQAGLLWPTLLSLVGLVILVSLGNWQMRRLAWKEALIARIEARSTEQPESLAQLVARTDSGDAGNVEALEFHRVRVSGRFRHDQEFHVWSPGAHGPAWSVVTPLTLSKPIGGRLRYPLTTVLVIRGTVLDANKSARTREIGNPQDEVTFTGRVRVGRTGVFSSAENVAKNEWYEFDIDAMRNAVAAAYVEGSASGTAQDARSMVAPFYIEAETQTGGPAGPTPELGNVNLMNRHLEYALTWYGLALTLLGVYAAFVWTRWRKAG